MGIKIVHIAWGVANVKLAMELEYKITCGLYYVEYVMNIMGNVDGV